MMEESGGQCLRVRCFARTARSQPISLATKGPTIVLISHSIIWSAAVAASCKTSQRSNEVKAVVQKFANIWGKVTEEPNSFLYCSVVIFIIRNRPSYLSWILFGIWILHHPIPSLPVGKANRFPRMGILVSSRSMVIEIFFFQYLCLKMNEKKVKEFVAKCANRVVGHLFRPLSALFFSIPTLSLPITSLCLGHSFVNTPASSTLLSLHRVLRALSLSLSHLNFILTILDLVLLLVVKYILWAGLYGYFNNSWTVWWFCLSCVCVFS